MKNKKEAESILDKFYTTLYNLVYDLNSDNSTIKVNAIAVSDCAVLFLSDADHRSVDQVRGLPKMLRLVRRANNLFINSRDFPFMTMCSIAYGELKYEYRTESEYIRKNCIKGSAYLSAYLDIENEVSKIQPGQCRLLKNKLNINVNQDPEFALLSNRNGYYYYYWNLSNSNEIDRFNKKYENTWNATYKKLIKLHQNRNRITT